MKSILAVSTVAAILLMGNGCSTQKVSTNSSAIQFNYKIENGKEAGLIQVFDMGGNTVLQIRDIELRKPLFLDITGKSIEYKTIGQYASLIGVHNYILVIANNSYAKVERKNTDSTKTAPITNAHTDTASPEHAVEASPLTSMKDASTTDIQNEIDRLKKELVEIKSMLARANAGSNIHSQKLYGKKVDKAETTMTVLFKFNSFKFEPMVEVKRMLVNSAQDASEIYVRGYTDSFVASKQGRILANKRAIEAKKYLVANGVSAEKITLSFEPYGHFISDNNTVRGRNENRRVEIAMH